MTTKNFWLEEVDGLPPAVIVSWGDGTHQRISLDTSNKKSLLASLRRAIDVTQDLINKVEE